MRIRKQPRGDARGRASPAQQGLRSGEIELDLSSRGLEEKQDDFERTKERGDEGDMKGDEGKGSGAGHFGGQTDRGASGSRSSFTWLDKLRHAKGFTAAEPHVNLDEFVSSLARVDSCPGEGETQAEPVAGESSLSRAVLTVDLNAGKLARDPVASALRSKPADNAVLARTTSLALVLCNDSSGTAPHLVEKERVDARLQSDASLPKPGSKRTAADRGKNKIEETVRKHPPDIFGVATLHACEDNDCENLALGFYVKNRRRKQEEPRLCQKSSDSTEQAARSSWTQDSSNRGADSSSEASEREKGTSIGKSDCAGTSSMKQKCEEITTARVKGNNPYIPLSPSTIEAIVEQGCASPETRIPSNAEPAHTELNVAKPDNIQSSASKGMQRRSSRNRKVSSYTGGEERRLAQPAAMAGPPASLAPDHPANQPQESLLFSMYTVYFRASKAGLTAREAVTNILQQGLAGLEKGGVESRRQVDKILRSSPYFMELGEGKFALCSAMIDAEQEAVRDEQMRSPTEDTCAQTAAHARAEGAKQARLEGTWQYWAALASSKRAKSKNLQPSEPSVGDQSRRRAGSEDSKRKSRLASKKKRTRAAREASDRDTDEQPRPAQTGRPKKLKYMKQENVEELGNQCNRTDGKGWTCPLLAKHGYQLCNHHLDKLRCKPGSRSKKKRAATLADKPLELDKPLLHAEEPQMVRRKTRTSRSALPTDETEILGTMDTAGHESPTPLDSAIALEDPVQERSS